MVAIIIVVHDNSVPFSDLNTFQKHLILIKWDRLFFIASCFSSECLPIEDKTREKILYLHKKCVFCRNWLSHRDIDLQTIT